MPETRFILEPKPNHSPAEVNDNPNSYNGRIKEYRGNKFIDHYDASPSLVKSLEKTGKLVKPEDYSQRERIMLEEGIEEGWRPLPDGKLGVGENPFKQLIYRTVRMEGGCKFSRIVDALMNEYRVVPKKKFVEGQVRGLVKEMGKEAPPLLLKKEEGYKIGGELKYGRLYKYKRGYDPREYILVDWISGMVEMSDIKSFLFDKLKWVDNSSTVNKIVERLMSKDVLESPIDGWYRKNKSLKPFKREGY